jgi:hypothetical protein
MFVTNPPECPLPPSVERKDHSGNLTLTLTIN